MRTNILLIILSTLLVSSCNNQQVKIPQADISELPEVDVKLHRYGKALFELDTTDFQNELKSIKSDFMIFLDANLDDTANVRQLYDYVTDTQLISIYKKSIEVFPNSKWLESELSDGFTRLKYYYPDVKIPSVYSYISDLYFEAPIWKDDTAMVVAIDLYLGHNFPLYLKLGLPFYKIRCMQPQNLVVDVMKTMYYYDLKPETTTKTLLDRMIEGGKYLVYLDAILPEKPDEVKICYTTHQMQWAEENEKNIWAFLVSNKILYSTDYQTQTKLIQDGPFTTGFSNESPSRLGVFIGWKIVAAFMINNPGVTIEEMINMTDSQKILQESRYKP